MFYSNRIIFNIIETAIDLIVYCFSDKETKDYIKKVPRFCRIDCGKVLECRNPNNNWRCYNGCLWLSKEDYKPKRKYKKKYK